MLVYRVTIRRNCDVLNVEGINFSQSVFLPGLRLLVIRMLMKGFFNICNVKILVPCYTGFQLLMVINATQMCLCM